MGAQAVRLSNIDIDNALKNKDFEVTFQPVFDLGNGALARVEAFVRWRHPSLGVLPPGAFISFFESQGRMSELTRYVLSQALSEYLAWRGPSAPGFSINLALSDLADEAFASHFSVLLRDRAFPADLITLECPMPPVTMPISAAAEHFARLASTGARLAIEVRGRANDFLRMIDPFPFDEIKTGGAAILRFARTVRGPGLSAISELIDIANNANAAITAVGVEDQASLAALRSLGFAAAQGNHLGRVGSLATFMPSRVNEVRKLLGLEPLSADDLHALFRTEAPALQQPEPGAEVAETSVAEDDQEQLVERLEARLARRGEAVPAAAPESYADASLEPRPAAPAKPKHAAAKAAAIARAKRKAAQRVTEESAAADMGEPESATTLEETALTADTNAARSLQERLAEEFKTSSAVAAAPSADDEFDIGFADEEFAEDAAAALPETAADEFGSVAADADIDADFGESAADVSEEFDFPVPAVAAAGAPKNGGFIRASLAVGRTGAYFRPGLRVGAAAPLSPPTETAFPPQAAKPAPLAATDDAESVVGHQPTEAAQTLAVEEPGFKAGERSRRKPGKNFLTRKYQVWPTHFWPRSLKRAWRRRQMAALQKQSEKGIAAAE
jgi:EAL domain-containing protein (putative c-di-GMP-specific phosphodiesterase class I)